MFYGLFNMNGVYKLAFLMCKEVCMMGGGCIEFDRCVHKDRSAFQAPVCGEYQKELRLANVDPSFF